MKKRILSLILAAAMLLAAFAFSSCESGKTAYTEGLEFFLDEDGESYIVCGLGDSTDTEIVIPPTYEDKPVTEIDDCAFCDEADITKVVIPDSVTKIGDWAFEGTSITSITIPASVTELGYNIVSGCTKLKQITVDAKNPVYYEINNCLVDKASKKIVAGCNKSVIPDDGSVTAIASYAFQGCDEIIAVTVPESITSLGENVFSLCKNLKSIVIPKSVTSITSAQFWGCDALTSVTVDEDNPVYRSEGNCLIETSTETVIAGCITSVIPDGIKAIDYSAFNGCNIKSIVIPDSVTFIDESAFADCKKLQSVTLGSGLEEIGYWAFYSCTSLSEVVIPAKVTRIGNSAFVECSSLESVIILSDSTEICEFAFEDCASLKSVVIPGEAESIGACALGYVWDEENSDDVKLDDFTIYGHAGTAAEEYAKENGFDFYAYSAHKPTEDGEFCHLVNGKIKFWNDRTEPFTGVKFTGATQEGSEISYDFDEEDEEELLNLLDKCDELVEAGEDYDTFIETIYDILDLRERLEDAVFLEDLRFCLYGDEEILDKYDHLNGVSLYYDQWADSMMHKIAESPFKSGFYEGMTDEEIAEFIGEEMPDEYYELSEELNGILYDFSLLDWSDEKNFETIENLYIRFVKAGNGIARLTGYDNYLEFLYPEEYGRTYSVEDTDMFFDYVKTYVVPEYFKYEEMYNNDLAALDEADKKLVNDFFKSDAFIEGFDEFYAYKNAVGGEFGEAFDNLWTEGGLFYISYDDIGAGAFENEIPSTGEPMVFFGRKVHDIMNIVHESGHYFEAYMGGETYNYDLAETQSQSNELLFLRFLKNNGFYSEEVMNVIKENKIKTFLKDIVVCSVVNELEKRAYADDDFTFGEADEIVRGLNRELGVEGDPFKVEKYWHYVVIDCAGYYISYATSLIGSFNIYKISEDDFGAAVDAYLKVVDYQNNGIPCDFEEVYAYAGLENIFTEEAFSYIFG